MADPKEFESVVERVVGEVLDSQMGGLRQAIVRRVLEEVRPALEAAASAPAKPPEVKPESPAGELDAAVASIQDALGQADILKALLEGVAKFAGRSALFVIRGGNCSGWQCRGFDEDNAVKGMSLDLSQGLAARAYQDRLPAAAAAAEFDSGFINKAGNPHDGNALVLPLLVKDKVAALVYADAGLDRMRLMDGSAVQLLVRSASLWLEVLSLRKTAPEERAEPGERMPEPPPARAAAAAVAEVAPPPAPVVEEPPPPPPAAAPAAEAAISPEDEEVHKKAKRFAKLLVDEIRLYNQAKVTEGRKHKDLFKRLQEDIEKSRATYDKRYGHTPAAAGDYFNKEVIRILANNDESLMGGGFSR